MGVENVCAQLLDKEDASPPQRWKSNSVQTSRKPYGPTESTVIMMKRGQTRTREIIRMGPLCTNPSPFPHSTVSNSLVNNLLQFQRIRVLLRSTVCHADLHVQNKSLPDCSEPDFGGKLKTTSWVITSVEVLFLWWLTVMQLAVETYSDL